MSDFVGGRGRPRRSRKPNALDQIVDVLSVSLLIRCIVLPFLIAAAARGTEQNGYVRRALLRIRLERLIGAAQPDVLGIKYTPGDDPV
jgi:hypothetical protein